MFFYLSLFSSQSIQYKIMQYNGKDYIYIYIVCDVVVER